ncbi:MAG: hypothetical protein H7289_05790 [Mucilaginibacter sp.]|nr:hypothetical protein [Mucilaginibacter sp.]
MKEIKIKRRWTSTTIIVLILLIFLFGFGWMNSLVSYKYEIQDTVNAGKVLDEHQKEILYWIKSSKVELGCSILLLIKGRVSYYDKKTKTPSSP